jgi:hypothetical protein
MSRSRGSFVFDEKRKKRGEIHPIWRGIGCVFMILIPILAYAASVTLVRENIKQKWVELPSELLGSITLPSMGKIYYADIVVALAMLFIIFALFTVAYAIVYRLVGPSFYGPLDALPQSKRRRR